MKNLKKVLALVLAVVMIMGVVSVASAKTYTDVKATDDYADAIDALSSLNILDGFKDGDNYSFKADETFTRAQAAKIVAIVHNAATNGAIKGQDAISALYSNAQNPFVDCNNSWALPFINYCRITGLADGMTATTYEPNRYVTGVQFLKLMLTTLNFDTNKEGYTGTGWDINVLNRANEIGLTDGLADGWKAIEPIKRGEAAQVLYNALTAYLVEYGQVVKGYKNTNAAVYNAAFVSNEQVAKSGFMLGEKMGIAIERATDAFRRPGYNWSYGTWTAFYMDKPLNSYTNTVSVCDILKNDMGIKETSTKEVTLDAGTKTVSVWDTKTQAFKDTTVEKLNYIAIDGYKWQSKYNQSYMKMTLAHDEEKKCQDTTGFFSENRFGGKGDLTQVFKTEDGYVITVIHTFLAEVTEVNLNNKYSHAKTEASKVEAYIYNGNDTPAGSYKAEISVKNVESTATEFAKGTKVLVTLSKKANQDSNMIVNEAAKYGNADLIDIAAAESKIGKLTGASDAAKAESVSIDGTRYSTNCRFVLGKNDAMQYANRYTQYTFYFDTYGNVIGCDDDTTAASYVVMDRIYGIHDNGKFVVKADLYDLDGKKIEAATVAQAGCFDDVKDGYGRTGDPHYGYDGYIYMVDSHNDNNLLNALYTYTVDDKGAYTLNWVGVYAGANEAEDGYGRYDGSFTHTAKLAYIEGTNTYNSYPVKIGVSESTKFVVKSVGGNWTSYTGYTALPALTAKYLDYTDADGDGFADIVYLGNATFAGDNITGWVSNWAPYDWANEYELITVYVDGEATVVNVKYAPNGYDNSNPAQPLTAGMYTFTMGTDADGVAYATAYKLETKYSGYVDSVSKISNDVTAIKLGNQYIGLTGVTIYVAKEDGSVVKADANAIEVNDYISYYEVGNEPYGVLYVVESAHRYTNP